METQEAATATLGSGEVERHKFGGVGQLDGQWNG